MTSRGPVGTRDVIGVLTQIPLSGIRRGSVRQFSARLELVTRSCCNVLVGRDRCEVLAVRDGVSARPWIVDDDLWALIEPLLPPWPEKAPGPRPVPDRLRLQGILLSTPTPASQRCAGSVPGGRSPVRAAPSSGPGAGSGVRAADRTADRVRPAPEPRSARSSSYSPEQPYRAARESFR